MARGTPSALAISSGSTRSEEHTSELQSPCNLVCRLLLEKKKKKRGRRKGMVQGPTTNFQEPGRNSTVPSDADSRPYVVVHFTQLFFSIFIFFFFNDTATTEIYPLSLHDALPIFLGSNMPRFRFFCSSCNAETE